MPYSTDIKDYYRRAWGLGDRPQFKNGKRVAFAKGVSGGWWGDWELNYKDQMTFEEYKKALDIDKNPSGLEKADGGRIGFQDGTKGINLAEGER